MLYIFFAIACVCSNYMIASEKQDKTDNKAYWDKILDDRVKDPAERAKYAEGYVVVGEGRGKFAIPISEVPVMVPVGSDGCFMSFPYPQAMSMLATMEKNKQEMENQNKLEMDK